MLGLRLNRLGALQRAVAAFISDLLGGNASTTTFDRTIDGGVASTTTFDNTIDGGGV